MKRRPIIFFIAILTAAAVCFASLPYAAATSSSDMNAPTAGLVKPNIYYRGDADRDGELSIMDATAIQRKLVDLERFTEGQEFLGDFDRDGELNIVDATGIQRKLAGLGDVYQFPSYTSYGVNLYFNSCNVRYPEYTYYPEVIYTGVKLNFELSIGCGIIEVPAAWSQRLKTVVEIEIDGEKVVSDLERDSMRRSWFSHVFTTPGNHTVTFRSHNILGESYERSFSFSVIDSPDKPYIADAHYDKTQNTVTVTAAGGTAPYCYRYYLYDAGPIPTECATENPVPAEPSPTEASKAPDISSVGRLIAESDENYVEIPAQAFDYDHDHYYQLYAQVIDSNSAESDLTSIFN